MALAMVTLKQIDIFVRLADIGNMGEAATDTGGAVFDAYVDAIDESTSGKV